MTTAKLILLRHGLTQYNVDGRFTGHDDIPLLPEGEEQARQAGTLLRGIAIDKVYSSPLQRAFNTAALALKAAGKNLPIEKRAEIIEADAGDFTGKRRNKPPISEWKWVYNIPLPNGESDKMVAARVQKLFDEEIMPRLRRGENVLVVAHSGVLHAFDIVTGIEEAPTDDKSRTKNRIPNAAPHICEYENGKLQKHYFMWDSAAAIQNTPPKNKYRPGP